MRDVVHIGKVLGDDVDAPQAGVGVGGREGHEAVRKVVGGDDVREARRKEGGRAERTVPIAHDGLHHEHGEVVG